MTKTTIYLPEDLQHDLEALAKQENRTKADLIREALRTYVQQKPRRLPKSIGMGQDGSLGASEIDSWIKENWIKDLGLDNAG
ncbi:MAG: CopG family transcriptional regulator [Trueperaceae bacterium]|nr:CopG family transcriptional regulator [Trueperaceae bacterium]